MYLFKSKSCCTLLLVWWYLFFISSFAISQDCAITTLNGEPIFIESTDTVALRFLIQDALNDQLGSNGQGVCGVNIEFIHQDVTDLNMTLYSPSGIPIILVGPAVTTSSSVKPFGVAHDITFIPSTSVAMPDPGLSDRWDNQDPDWGTQSAYAGFYYPFSGDLDVNYGTGPVNGIWELVIVDQFPTVQNASRFISFQLEFCQPDLDCQECEALSGSFTIDSLAICEGQNFDFKSIYSPELSDDSLYSEIFLSYSGDQLFSRDSLPDFEGMFESYVVTILKEQEAMFRQELNSLNNRVALLNLVESPGGVYCIDISKPLALSINQTSGISAQVAMDTVILGCADTQVELDASFSSVTDSTMIFWRDMENNLIGNDLNIFVEEVGSYTLTLDDNVCQDSTRVLVLSEVNQASAALTSTIDTLNCLFTSSILSYSTDIIVLQSSWRNATGDLISADSTVMIDSPGTFYLELQGAGECMIVDSIMIYSDLSEPNAAIAIDSITCSNREINIRLQDEVNVDRYEWYNSDGILVSESNTLSTTSGGEYSLVLIAQNGCDKAQNFVIPVDTISPVLLGVPLDTFFTCLTDEISLNLRSLPQTDFILSQSIDGGPFTIANEDPSLTIAGSYQFTANFENGCISRYSTEVVDNRFSIDETLPNMTLTCDIDSLQILYDIDTSEFTFLWSGGSLEGIIDPFPYVKNMGDFELIATDPVTRCTATLDISILSDRDDPMVSVVGDSLLTCSDSNGRIELMTDANSAVTWLLPSNDTLLERNIDINEPGTYSYTVQGVNGCNVSGEWIVTEDIESPVILLQDQYFITCDVPMIELSVDSSTMDGVSWYYSDNTISTQTDITLFDNDLDSVVVTGSNGCETSQSIEVLIDQVPPAISILNRDTVLCTPTTLLLEVIADQAPDQLSFEWTNNNEFVGTGNNLLTNDTGAFVATATLLRNGCVATDDVIVGLTETPIFGLGVDFMDESCLGDADGELTLVGVNGGVEPFDILLNGQPWMPRSSSDLTSGDYSISVIDANGCQLDTTVIIQSGANIDVELGPDRSIDVGSTISISATTSGDILDFGWFVNSQNNPSGNLSSLTIVAENDTEIIMQVFSEEGCSAVDTVLIDAVFSIDNVDIYIPNAFAVNGSDRNNTLKVNLTEAIISIDRFRVYDRWGALVHEVQPQGRFNVELWDGRIQGQQVNPGVFVYVCEVTTAIDNIKKVYKGNVTVFD